MERLAQLISKLKEQFEHNADHSQMLVTTQLIEAELMRAAAPKKTATSNSKISVMMPAMRKPVFPQEQEEAKQEYQQEKLPDTKNEIPDTIRLAEEAVSVLTHQQEEHSTPHQAKKAAWLYDPIHDVPTLSHQESVKDLNEIMGLKDPSLNDRLKAEIIEVGHQLTDTPIRDLKRAIGVNDRFVFVNELFRGDEVMYERSIKTINAFRIYAEAEYWIERELKVKLGWEEDNSTTRYFYTLVRRRFS